MTALEEYTAHVPKRPKDASFGWSPKCGCIDVGPGWVTSSIKDDGERTWGDVCPVGSELWEKVRREVGILLNDYGEILTMYPQMTPARWEASALSTCGVHLVCDSFMDVKRVSFAYSVLHCRGCGLRVYIHGGDHIKTIADLRQWYGAHVLIRRNS